VRFVLLCLLLLTIGPAAGQNRVADSLRRQLAATRADTSRVLLLNALCDDAGDHDAVQALAYGQQALALARSLHFHYGEAGSLNALAQAEHRSQNYLATTRYYQQAMQVAEREPRATRQLIQALIGLGRLAAEQEEFIEADNYFRLAIRRMQQGNKANLMDLVVGANQLATLYLGWLESGRPAPDSLTRLHAHYARLALTTFRRMPADMQRREQEKLAFCLDNLGMVHQRAHRYDSVFYYENQALRLFYRFDNKYGMTHAQQLIAQVRLAQHRWPEAAELLPPTIRWARQLHAVGFEAQGRQLLAQALDNTGQSHAAYQMARAAQQVIDSLASTEQRTALARLRVQFETERQRAQVRTLTQRNQQQRAEAEKQRQHLLWLGGLLVAVVAGLVASGLLAWRLRRSRALLAHQNAELTATRAEQDRLYALVAHDLRNPVEAFTGLADLLTRYVERQDTARLAGLGGRVRQAAQGLRGLLDNLLSWALTQRGELTPNIENLAVADLLSEAVELYQPSAEAADIRLTALLPATPKHVTADLNMTRTILRNLISNALRATPAGGTITLAVGEGAAGTVAIEVRDTGEGMSAEQVQLLLTAAPRPSTGRPAGLGLRLSRAFAQAQSGQLALFSQPSQGTRAVLTLPGAAVAPPEPVVWERPVVQVPEALVSGGALDAAGRAANGATHAVDGRALSD
jgi:signal transduction histidine kinase